MINRHFKTLFITASIFASALPTLAQPLTIQGIGTASAINANQFAGLGTLRIGNQPTLESSVATILALGPGPGNTLVGESMHEINVGLFGSFVTHDDVRLVPIDAFGNFQLHIRAQIVSGTGTFAGRTGILNMTGFANLATGQVIWKMQGRAN